MTAKPVSKPRRDVTVFLELRQPGDRSAYVVPFDVIAIEQGGAGTCRVVLTRGHTIHAINVIGDPQEVASRIEAGWREGEQNVFFALMASEGRRSAEQRITQHVLVGLEKDAGQLLQRIVDEILPAAVGRELARLAAEPEGEMATAEPDYSQSERAVIPRTAGAKKRRTR